MPAATPIATHPLVASLALLALLPAPEAPGSQPPPPNPRITALTPLAVPPGFTGTLRLRGFDLQATTEIRSAAPAGPVTVEIQEKKDAATPAGMDQGPLGTQQLMVHLSLPADFPPGPLALTAVAGDQTSPAITLQVVAAAALIEEKEPNNGFRTATAVATGSTVTGLIHSPRDVDVFAVTGVAGQPLHIEVIAQAAASLIDPLLTAHHADGHALATADDANPSTRDTRLEITPTENGPIYIVLQDALDFGSEWHSYRLEVATAR